MLKIYPGLLKVVNPKLYNSPYMVSVDEVIRVIDRIDENAKKLFLKNLLTLKIEKNGMNNPIIGSYYDYGKNIIYTDNVKDNINHELCHVAGRRYNMFLNIEKNGILNFFNEEDSLNEGIVEYLSLLSLGKDVSNSLYQFEVFVVECLVSIYGISVLEPYFKADRVMFYKQFENEELRVQRISILLTIISSLNRIHSMRLNYLLAYSQNSNNIDVNYFRGLKLNFGIYQLIDKYFKENKESYLKLKELKGNGINIYNYPYNEDLRVVFDEMEDAYKGVLTNVGHELLEQVINLYYNNSYSRDKIRDEIISIYNNKSKRFKDIFGEVIYNDLNKLTKSKSRCKGRGSV